MTLRGAETFQDGSTGRCLVIGDPTFARERNIKGMHRLPGDQVVTMCAGRSPWVYLLSPMQLMLSNTMFLSP